MENNGLGALTSALSEKTKINRAIDNLGKLANVNSVEVKLPILKTSAIISPLSGTDDLLQKTVKASGYQFLKLFNELLYKNSKFTDLEFESQIDFENHLTTPDKNILIYGLLDATYTTLPEKLITCPHCEKQDEYILKPSDMIQKDTFSKQWEKEKDFKEFEKVVEIVPGFKIVYQMATENKKIDIVKSKRNSELQQNIKEGGSILNNIELIAMYTKRLEIKDTEEKDGILKIEETDKILEVLNSAPPEIKIKVIETDNIDEFFEYNPNFYMKLKCKNDECLKDFDWFDINPELDFFRKSVSIY